MSETRLQDSLRSITVLDKDDKVSIRSVMNDAGFGNVNIVEDSDSN
jgi:hypothetical protein